MFLVTLKHNICNRCRHLLEDLVGQQVLASLHPRQQTMLTNWEGEANKAIAPAITNSSDRKSCYRTTVAMAQVIRSNKHRLSVPLARCAESPSATRVCRWRRRLAYVAIATSHHASVRPLVRAPVLHLETAHRLSLDRCRRSRSNHCAFHGTVAPRVPNVRSAGRGGPRAPPPCRFGIGGVASVGSQQ